MKKFSKIDESNTDALYNLGLTCQEIEGKDTDKKFTKSIKQFEKIIQKDSNHVNALTSLGILFFKIQKYTHSFNYIEKAISVSEHDDWRALLAMGCILSDGKQDYVAANGYFDKCECFESWFKSSQFE